MSGWIDIGVQTGSGRNVAVTRSGVEGCDCSPAMLGRMFSQAVFDARANTGKQRAAEQSLGSAEGIRKGGGASGEGNGIVEEGGGRMGADIKSLLSQIEKIAEELDAKGMSDKVPKIKLVGSGINLDRMDQQAASDQSSQTGQCLARKV